MHRVILSTPINTELVDVTSASVNIGSPSNGQLALIFVSTYDSSGGNLVTPVGWTELFLDIVGTIDYALFGKECDGTEGSTVSLVTNGSPFDVAAKAYILDGATPGILTSIDVSTGVFQDSSASIANIEPASVTAGWGAEPTNLYMTFCAAGRTNTTFNTLPPGYDFTEANSGVDAGGYGTQIAVGSKVSNTATEDPSEYATQTFRYMATFTVVIRGVSLPSILPGSRYSSGGAGVTLGGAGSDKLLVVIPISRTVSGSTPLSVDVGGVAAVEHSTLINVRSATKAQMGIFYILGANIPSGSNVITNTWDGAEDNSQGVVFEIENVDQTNPLSSISSTLSTVTEPSPVNLSSTLTGYVGKLGITLGLIAENSFMNDGGFVSSVEGHSLIADTKEFGVNTYARLAAYSDTAVGSASETYTHDLSLRGGSINSESTIAASFAVNAPEVNVAPVLDTPHADISIDVDFTGQFDLASGFSDANGHTLSYTVLPTLPTGLTLSSVGLLTVTGTLSATTAADYTITADDGNGLTATDIVNIEVTPPALSAGVISNSAPEPGETFTVAVANPAATVTASVGSGALAIDSQTATELTITAPHPLTHGDKTLDFNEDITVTITDGGTVDTFVIQVAPETGYFYDKIVTNDASGIYADDGAGVVAGVSVYGQLLQGDVDIDLTTGLWTVSKYSEYRYALSDTEWSGFVTEVFEDPTRTKVTVASASTAEGSVLEGATGVGISDGDFIYYDAVTSPDGIAVTVASTGVWSLASMPVAEQTFQAYVVKSGGGIGDIATFTFEIALERNLQSRTINLDLWTAGSSGLVRGNDKSGSL